MVLELSLTDQSTWLPPSLLSTMKAEPHQDSADFYNTTVYDANIPKQASNLVI